MPTLDIEEDDLSDGTEFQTEYVMWDNMGLERVVEDVSAYQMGSMVMERLNIQDGLLNLFHQTMKDHPEYENELELLQYDMLYGDKNVYDGVNPYTRKNMTFGVYPIEISDISTEGEVVYVNGSNFTLWSEVYVSGKKVDSYFVDENLLIVPNLKLEAGTKIKVSQITRTGRKLSSTKSYIITEEDL